MQVIGIDPGTTHSAYAMMIGRRLQCAAKVSNDDMLESLLDGRLTGSILLIEQVACYGMPVGAEVFQTVHWAGRFHQAWLVEQGPKAKVDFLTRNDVKKTLCHKTVGVNDAVIRQRLIDLYGGKEAAIGKKKTPGPLYGVTKDEWAAVALCVAWQSRRGEATT